MKNRIKTLVSATLFAFVIGGCASEIPRHEKPTLAASSMGGMVGSVVTGGSTSGSAGGILVAGRER